MVTFQQIRDFIESKDWQSLAAAYTESKSLGFNPPLDAATANKIRQLMIEAVLFGPEGSHGFPRVLLNALDDVAQQTEDKDTENRVVDAVREELSKSRRVGKVGDATAISFQINRALAIINPLRVAIFEPDGEPDWGEVSIALDIAAEELYEGIKMV